nr:hypothetical protein [uncultured Allomuricauda sp.]
MELKNTIFEKRTYHRDMNWLFDFTQNFTERKKWDKQTLEIDFFEGFTALKKGVKVYTKSIEGVRMETEYLTFNPPYEISIRMINKSPIFKDFVGTWEYSSNGNKETTLKITYRFNLKFPYTLVKRKVLLKIKRNITKKLLFLENHLQELGDKNSIP